MHVPDSDPARDAISGLFHSGIELAPEFSHLDSMAKTKIPATGEGFLGETMVHRISRAVGIVEIVTEGKAGWPPEIALKLADGSFKKGKLSDFREPSKGERKKIPPA